jgi:hypothetical protein
VPQAGEPMSKNRREFTRLRIPREQSATFLRAGLRQFTVHLIDATAQGFAVTCPARLEVCCGDTLQLRTSEGWIEVRVARVEPLENSGEFSEEYDCFIGLQRVRALGFEPDDFVVTAGNPYLYFCGLFVALVLGLVLGIVLLPRSNATWRSVQNSVTSFLPAGR